MKKIITVGSFLIAVASLSSCGSSSKPEDKDLVEVTVEDSVEDAVEEQEASVSLLATADDSDWDQMLDDYEEYVDRYIMFYKKAMKGDMEAMAGYPELLEKANDLQASMEKAQTDNRLSVSQVRRISEIQTKMLKGIQ